MKNCLYNGLIFGIILLIVGVSIVPAVGKANDYTLSSEQLKIVNSENNVLTASDTDWWPMFRHDAGNTGCSPSEAPETNEISWTFETQQYIEGGSPVVSNNKLFIGTIGLYALNNKLQTRIPYQLPESNERGKLLCLNAISGKEIWSEEFGYIPNAPAVLGNQVIFNSMDPDTWINRLYSYDVETGEEQWNILLDDRSWSPIIYNDKIYVSSINIDGIIGHVDCIYASNGSVAWSYDSPIDTYIMCSPAIYEDKIYIAEYTFYDRVVCLNASTGQFIWDQYLELAESYTIAVSDGRVFVAGYDESWENGIVYCLSSATGAFIWDYPMGPHYVQYPTYPALAVSEEEILITSYDWSIETSYVHCINPLTGYALWQQPIQNAIFGSPSVADGKIYISSLPGIMYCLDISDGAQIWSYYLGYGSVSSPAIANGYVYMTGLYGTVFSFGEPTAPSVPSIVGETSGKFGETYDYTISSSDPQNEDILYFIDWDDGDTEEWIGPYSSGEEVIVSHTWDEEGTYTIRAKAKDIFDAESDWGTLDVTMPVNQQSTPSLFLRFLERFPLLEYLFNLLF